MTASRVLQSATGCTVRTVLRASIVMMGQCRTATRVHVKRVQPGSPGAMADAALVRQDRHQMEARQSVLHVLMGLLGLMAPVQHVVLASTRYYRHVSHVLSVLEVALGLMERAH